MLDVMKRVPRDCIIDLTLTIANEVEIIPEEPEPSPQGKTPEQYKINVRLHVGQEFEDIYFIILACLTLVLIANAFGTRIAFYSVFS